MSILGPGFGSYYDHLNGSIFLWKFANNTHDYVLSTAYKNNKSNEFSITDFRERLCVCRMDQLCAVWLFSSNKICSFPLSRIIHCS